MEGMSYFPFTLIFSQIRSKKYFTSTKEECKKWLEEIKDAIGYANLQDYYDIKESLGKGKFGIVKCGVHKKTGKRVAIKVMKKSSMSTQDKELVNQEIEILKMCQHPNIIKLLDVFENIEYIYIVMELLEGGDMFSYLEKRRFKLPEARVAKIIHSLAAGVYYLHNYGIVHRDLKPENILMTDKTENSEVKIVDFGLSKIIGPTQTCREPFGTLSYVAPEVLQQKPYGKPVDVWTLGILAYMMLVGALPFDHEEDREVAKLTIYKEPDFYSAPWKKITKEGTEFVKRLLIKDPEKRMTLREVLQHPWITRDIKEVREARRNSLPGNAFELFSIVKPDTTNLLKEIQKKQLT